MIIVDANLLLYAYDRSAAQHKKARDWVEQTFSSPSIVGLPWQSISAFLRIMTNSRLPGDRFTPEEAAQIVDQWLARPNVQLLTPGERHWPLLRQMILAGQARGPLITDAHLAALSIEYSGIFHTTDRDFARFPRLRWTNPLE